MVAVQPLLLAVVLISLLAPTNALSLHPSQTSPLKAWDNVLPDANQRQALHEFASQNGLGHACFSRPLKSREGRNPIELALDGILSEIDGDTEVKPHFVEYWSRQEWRHIAAHADVDENLAKVHDKEAPSSIDELQTKFPSTYHNRSGGYRYPIHGHVLYLQVGTDVKGPTVVFPGYSSGGDLHGKRTNINDEECTSSDEAVMEHSNHVQMISVPAVPGRLLRFNGEDIHVVPRPHDLWLLPFVSGSADFEPVEQWGRSVILFNIWPGDEDPPLDVPLDEPSSVDCPTETKICNSYSDWKSVPISQPNEGLEPTDSNAKQSVKVWLVGNERRRDYAMRTVPLLCPENGGQEVVRDALSEDSKMTELWLRQP